MRISILFRQEQHFAWKRIDKGGEGNGSWKSCFLKRNLPDNYLVEEFSKLPAANVADCMGRLCGMNPSIRLMSNPSEAIMCGVALTVKARPGDNMMLHKAMNMSMPGDVIVVSNEGERSRAIMGEIMYNYMQGFKKLPEL